MYDDTVENVKMSSVLTERISVSNTVVSILIAHTQTYIHTHTHTYAGVHVQEHTHTYTNTHLDLKGRPMLRLMSLCPRIDIVETRPYPCRFHLNIGSDPANPPQVSLNPPPLSRP